MFEALSINTQHKDLIHDVAFDFYGNRMATCSSDQFVKVWDTDEHGNWQCTTAWKAHSGSVWKVTWAHPEYGQVLATCSFDRTAAVWEEIAGETGPVWVRRTNMVDSRTSVTDVKFAPRQLGLQLATSSADGVLRVYEAPDVMNLSQWTVQHEIPCRLPISCLTWNCSFSSDEPSSPQISLVGGGGASAAGIGLAKVTVYEYSENSRRWTRVEAINTVTEPVHDIAFAPNLGRSFHLLAVASKDVRLIILRPSDDGITATGLTKFTVELAARFEDHYSVVWRVAWNITGTVLASSGDDNCVRLWKGECVEVLRDDTSSSHTSQESDVLPVGSASSTAHVFAAIAAPAALNGGSSPAARYYKLGTIKNPNQVPWH
ncbi:hypothetical protein B566_EDAN007276 [Ephemera danica]|nr:hypothetical protein B566_EDAN007276 [Ephemera danica]